MTGPDEPRHGARLLVGAGFADDDGAADVALTAALTAYAAQPLAALEAEVLQALAGARLLVPVVAVLGEVETGDDGLRRDKSSEMAAVLMQGADGRTALLAFTGLDSMRRWDPAARPVPVPATVAAQAALADGAAALLLDVAGPVRFVSTLSSRPG